MAAQTAPRLDHPPRASHVHAHDAARYLAPLGRTLFAAIFLLAAPHHLAPQTAAAVARQVPFATVLVPASGILALVGGLSVLLGYKAKIGAWLLVAFLVPVTLTMHAFWNATDPTTVMIQQVMFMKNLSMLGGALLIAYFGAGPVSLDSRAGVNAAARPSP